MPSPAFLRICIGVGTAYGRLFQRLLPVSNSIPGHALQRQYPPFLLLILALAQYAVQTSRAFDATQRFHHRPSRCALIHPQNFSHSHQLCSWPNPHYARLQIPPDDSIAGAETSALFIRPISHNNWMLRLDI